MLERRLQILMDEARYRRLAAEAKRRGVSVASVVRQALDEYFGVPGDRRAQAALRILDAARTPIGEPDEVKAEIRAARERRA